MMQYPTPYRSRCKVNKNIRLFLNKSSVSYASEIPVKIVQPFRRLPAEWRLQTGVRRDTNLKNALWLLVPCILSYVFSTTKKLLFFY